jgi:hypothetical protein
MALSLLAILLTADDLLVQATRCLAAIRITVRKAPEVLLAELRETTVVDWLFVRLSFVLSHVKDAGIRVEIISTFAAALNMWKSANPSTWSDLRKCTEIIKSYISSTFSHCQANGSNITRPGLGRFDENRLNRYFYHLAPHKGPF